PIWHRVIKKLQIIAKKPLMPYSILETKERESPPILQDPKSSPLPESGWKAIKGAWKPMDFPTSLRSLNIANTEGFTKTKSNRLLQSCYKKNMMLFLSREIS